MLSSELIDKRDIAQDAMIMNVWRILCKRKWIIAGVLGLSVAIACLHVYSIRPIYESTATLQVGFVGPIGSAGSGFLEQPAMFAERVKEKYNISASVDRTTNSVVLIAYGSTAVETQKSLSDVITAVLQEHDRVYSEAHSLQKKRLSSLQQQIKAIDGEVNYYEMRIGKLQSMSSASNDKIELAWEKDRLTRLRADLERQASELGLTMTPIATRPTQVLKEPTLPIRPVTPKPAYEVTIASLGGIVFGIFAAICIEFIVTRRHTR